MALTQTQIIQSLGEALTWFEREINWGVSPSELKHLTGRIGELYAAMMTRGQMALETHQRGYDVISSDNERISVKTVTSSNHVKFNSNTFEHVDRVMVLRLNMDEETGISVETLLDVSAAEYKENYCSENADTMTFNTSSSGTTRRPLSDLTIVETASFQSYEIRRYENDSIEVIIDGQVQSMAKPHLREIANKIGVDIDYDIGKEKNTRLLGAHVIRKIKALQAA